VRHILLDIQPDGNLAGNRTNQLYELILRRYLSLLQVFFSNPLPTYLLCCSQLVSGYRSSDPGEYPYPIDRIGNGSGWSNAGDISELLVVLVIP